MKSDDDGGNMEMYHQLLQSSRKIFQCASRENVSIVCTYQLALYMKNQRFLDASTLSNGKQIKEVFSEMIYIRELWQDEYTGEKCDCHAYTRTRKPDGTWENLPPPSRWIKPKSTSSPFSIKPVTMKTVSNFCMKQTSAGTTGKRSAIVPSAMTM